MIRDRPAPEIEITPEMIRVALDHVYQALSEPPPTEEQIKAKLADLLRAVLRA